MKQSRSKNHFQNTRIINPKTIFLHGLPQFLNQQTALHAQLVMFGHIVSIHHQTITKDFYSSFVTYHHEASAALAIIMLDQGRICNRELRVYYGTTKFCPYFLRGTNCELSICNYAHFYIPELTHQKHDARLINHKQIAMLILNSLGNYLPIIYNIMAYENQSKILFKMASPKIHKFLADYHINLPPIMHKSVSQSEKGFTGHQETKKIKQLKQNNEDWRSILIQVENVKSLLEGQNKENKTCFSSKANKVQVFLQQTQKFLQKLIFQSFIF